MRPAAVALALVMLFPTASAHESYHHYYVVAGGGFGGGGLLVRNGETYFPTYDLTNVSVEVSDVSGQPVRVRLCHEWTYDDGSHPDVWCKTGCSPHLDDNLTFPIWPHNTTYRVIVDLRGGPEPCAQSATAGELRVSFT